MHERLQLCQDSQTEFALVSEGLGVRRINHIVRVHGHTILTEEAAAKTVDEAGHGSLGRLCPGFAEDGAQQATLGAGQSGIGCKRSFDVSRPPNLGAVVAARPRNRDTIRDAPIAGV